MSFDKGSLVWSSRVLCASFFASWMAVCTILFPAAAFGTVPACSGYTGWNGQINPPTDAAGLANNNFPEASNTTYFGTVLTAPIGTVFTIHGEYPLCRFMALEIYTGDTLVDFINDFQINPDAGTNNPFVSGSAQGTFTVNLVFGPQPTTVPPNTLYTGTLTTVGLVYRLYHTTYPNSITGSSTNPVNPIITVGTRTLPNCPIQPILPANSTPWDRLDLGNWIGTIPTGSQIMNASQNPTWTLTNPATAHYFPNGADYYIRATLSRQFLAPNSSENLFVMRFMAATFPNTRAGVPVYADRQVRFWSVCTDDPYTTNVNRCTPDDSTTLDPSGYATVVISDPGSAPTSAALTQFNATWLAWGALDLPTDVVYDRQQNPWGITTPVQYYNDIIYRQTLANATFTQSFVNVAQLPAAQQPAAAGPYWPVSGYCSTAAFEASGAKCLKP
jgi:hypothetical protein